MTALVSHIDIARPPEEVFRYATDPTRFPQWQDNVVDVELDKPANAVGARFKTTRKVGGTDRTMTQEVTRVEAPRAWAAKGIDGPVRPNATITIEPIDNGRGSHVTFALDFEGHGLGKPLAPMVRKMAEKAAPHSYRRLKELLEHPTAQQQQAA